MIGIGVEHCAISANPVVIHLQDHIVGLLATTLPSEQSIGSSPCPSLHVGLYAAPFSEDPLSQGLGGMLPPISSNKAHFRAHAGSIIAYLGSMVVFDTRYTALV